MKLIEEFKRYRYIALFTSIMALLVVQPFIGQHEIFIPIIFFFIMFCVLWTLEVGRGLFWLLMSLAVFSLVMSLTNGDDLVDLELKSFKLLNILNLVSYSVFLFSTTLIILIHLFKEDKVTLHTIRGGITVYFMMGLFWTFLYALFVAIDSSTIQMTGQYHDLSELMYFSFTTLTTLGYGDVVPISEAARNIAVLEAAAGQIFLTVLIARLIGLYIAQKKGLS
jgi:hypothetical protein